MVSSFLNINEGLFNPLDVAEEVLTRQNWPFERISEADIGFEFVGSYTDIKAWIGFNGESHSMILACGFETRVPERLKDKVRELLAIANEKVWIGLFEMSSVDNLVCYRYGMLLAEDNKVTPRQMETIMLQAYAECERFYPALQSVVWAGSTPGEALEQVNFDALV